MPLKTKELYCGSRQHLHPDSHNDVQFCMNRVQAGKNFPVPRVIPDCNRFSVSFPPTGETGFSSLVSLVSRFLTPLRIGRRIGHLPAV